MRKIVLFMVLAFGMHLLQAQKSIVLEKMRCFSATGMTMSYFKDEITRRAVAGHLSRALLQFQKLPLDDTSTISNIEYLNSIGNISPVNISFNDPEASQLHLYIDLFEIAPETFFGFPDNIPADTTVLQRARSVFLLKATLIKPDKKTIVFSEQLNVVVCAAETGGMGILFKYGDMENRIHQLVATQKGFTELIKAAANILFNPANQMEMVEMKVAPAFLGDNYILVNTVNQPKIFVTTVKNISTYTYAGNREMIRMGDPVYEEILIKGKKPQKYPADITEAIKRTDHFANSDFVFLRQECRDVIRDKNYLVKLTTQVDPGNMFLPPLTFTNFLAGKFHYLLLDKDTIAAFNILKRIPDEDKRIYLNRVSNGLDTSTYALNTVSGGIRVTYPYVATGVIGNRKFTINCSGFGKTVKEILLDNKLVCIAQGRFSPEKFVILDASLSSELLNQLFMIGFNRFFE